jgi:hypothetical protein
VAVPAHLDDRDVAGGQREAGCVGGPLQRLHAEQLTGLRIL